MNYQWLFFDADGTLFDYDLAEARALEGTFRDFSLAFQPSTSAAYRRINAQIWLDFENGRVTAEALRTRRFLLLFEEQGRQAGGAQVDGVQVDGVQVDVEAFSARYLVQLSRASDLMEGAEETLRALHRRYRLALITNGLKDVQRPRLAGSTISELFEEVAISEEMGVAKPDPLYFARVFERIGHPPKSSILVIGDSLSSDIQGGINYGLDTCWYNPRGKPRSAAHPVQYEIRRLAELKDMLLS